MRAPSRILLVTLLALAALVAPEALAPLEQELRVEPDRVDVTMVYRGTSVRVTAPVPVGAGVAIVVQGGEGDLPLKRKGKVLGLVWMNVGDVTFSNVPALYLVHTSCAFVDLADAATLRGAGLGFGALGNQSPEAALELREQLARLKSRDGLWAVSEGSVDVKPGASGAVAVTDFVLPAKAPPGEYRVLAYAFEDGAVRKVGEGRVTIAQAGAAAFVSALAARHGLLYGVLAVLVAAGAGLLTGVAFGLGGGKGH